MDMEFILRIAIRIWRTVVSYFRGARIRVTILLVPNIQVRNIVRVLLTKSPRDKSSLQTPDSFAALIRLYAHAVEKSCYCQNFDPTRAVDKARTLRNLLGHRMVERVDRETIAWAKQLLTLYDQRKLGGELAVSHPTRQCLSPEDYNCCLRVLSTRRSVRCFEPKVVSRDVVFRAVEFARFAPTSCNRQAVKFFATTDFSLATQAHALCPGRSGFSEPIPGLVVVATDVNPYSMPDEYSLLFIDGAICAYLFVLGCHLQGLGATLMAWNSGRDREESRLREILQIPQRYQIVMACAFGYVSNQWPSIPRKNMSEWIAFANARDVDDRCIDVSL